MAITQHFDLNMIPDSEPVIVHVNQYDTGTGRLVARLYSGNVPYSPVGTAAIQGTKPDGIGFMYSATINGNTVTANLTDQMSVIAGSVRCQIVVTETSGMTGTFCFDLEVQPSALPDDTSISESDYPIIEEMIRDAQEAAADATIAKADAENAASDSEAWAVGTRGGDPVGPSDPTYQNNSKYYAEHGGGGSGGHVIMDESGNDMPARGTLQFLNMEVTDDPIHLKTVVTGSKGLLPYLYIDSEAGATVTVTAPDSSTITPMAAGSGHWECELGGYGVYVIHSVLSGDDATYSLTVDSVKEYHVTDTHYDFTINVTTHSGATIRVSAGTEIYTETGTGSPVAFVVHQVSTVYTIEVTYQGHSASQTVTSAATTGQSTSVTINVVPDGSTVTPTDDIQTWLNCANIWDKAYTTLNEVLADHDTLYLLMGSNNAVDYLVRSTTWASGITADEYAMKYIGKWNYASSALLDASAWETGILASTYKDYIINAKIPTMTSDTTPSGVASFKGGAIDDNRKAWKAFDGNTGHAASQTATSALTYQDDDYIQYQFATETKITNGRIQWINTTPAHTFKTLMVDVSTDGTNFTEIYRSDIAQGTLDYSFTTTAGSALYVRAHQIGGRWGGGDNRMCIDQLQFWGRQDVTENVIDIYSAASDTVYYTEDGQDITVCTTDETGHGTVSKSNLPNGTYTLKSTVADDPTNLSNKYSKSVTITDGTSEIYVMPEGAVYWYGFFKVSMTAHAYRLNSLNTAVAPTITKNLNSFGYASSGQYNRGVFSTDTSMSADYDDVFMLSSTGTISSNSSAGLQLSTTNADGYQIYGTNDSAGASYTDKKFHAYKTSSDTNDYYIMVSYLGGTNITVQAIWCE